MKEQPRCELCNEKLPADFDGEVCLDTLPCRERQIDLLKAENKKLKAAVLFWKDGWSEGREIIGKLWMHHPAIGNDKERAYYQQHLRDVERVNRRVAQSLCTNLACADCAAKEIQ